MCRLKLKQFRRSIKLRAAGSEESSTCMLKSPHISRLPEEETRRSRREVNSSRKRGKVRRFLVDGGGRYTTIRRVGGEVENSCNSICSKDLKAVLLRSSTLSLLL